MDLPRFRHRHHHFHLLHLRVCVCDLISGCNVWGREREHRIIYDAADELILESFFFFFMCSSFSCPFAAECCIISPVPNNGKEGYNYTVPWHICSFSPSAAILFTRQRSLATEDHSRLKERLNGEWCMKSKPQTFFGNRKGALSEHAALGIDCEREKKWVFCIVFCTL